MAGYDNPRERGIRRVYHGRAKIGGFPPFKGMHRPSDAGVIGDDEFDWLQNMRLDGGGHLQSRGGQAKKFTTNIGTVAGIFEAGELGDPTARTVAPTVPGGTAVIPATLAPTGVQLPRGLHQAGSGYRRCHRRCLTALGQCSDRDLHPPAHHRQHQEGQLHHLCDPRRGRHDYQGGSQGQRALERELR
jgi:hypothetical protein